MKRLRKISLVFFFFLLVVTLQPARAQAPTASQATPVSQTPQTSPATSQQNTNLDVIYSNVDPKVERNMHSLSQNALIGVLASTTCMLSGYDPLNPVNGKCLGYDPTTGKLGYSTSHGGATTVMANLIGGTFAIPVSGAGYTQYLASNFGLTKSAYAQTNGLGYSRLSPLMDIWSRFRDIAYLGFVLAFTVIGLAIMFRVKIDARTVMTIQNQIPKIVIALILVTLSYAIAGFMIDIMYVAIFLVVLTFNGLTNVNLDVNSNLFSVVNKAFSPSEVNLGFTRFNFGIIGLTGEIAASIASIFSSIARGFLDSTTGQLFKIFFTPFGIVDLGCKAFDFINGFQHVGKIPLIGDFAKSLPLVGGIFGGGSDCNFVDQFYAGFVGVLFTILAFLVVLIAILFTLFRVWFMLVKSFVYILIDVMVAPLWITAGIFPGSKLSFGGWFRHLAGHLSIFPMTFAIILFGKTMMDAVHGDRGFATGGSHELFSPPLLGGAVGGANAVAAFIGFGFILSMPTILERTKKAVGAADFGLKDIRTSFGMGTGLGQTGINTAFGSGVEYDSHGSPKAMGKQKLFLRNIGVFKH